MIDWIQKALTTLTLDEFERVISKAQFMYKSSCKIIHVNRPENKGARVTIQLPSGQKKLVVL